MVVNNKQKRLRKMLHSSQCPCPTCSSQDLKTGEEEYRSARSKFSKELRDKSAKYIKSKTNKQPTAGEVNDFLTQVAELGNLFLINIHKFDDTD